MVFLNWPRGLFATALFRILWGEGGALGFYEGGTPPYEGGTPSGDPNLGTPTFPGKSPDREIPAPMEAASLGGPRKNMPRGAGPLLGGLANLMKADPAWLVYNTI